MANPVHLNNLRNQSAAAKDAQRALDEEAYRLRTEEMLTLQGIGERMGCSGQTAMQRCRRAEARLLARHDQDAQKARIRQERRLEQILSEAWEDYHSDRDPKRLDRVLKTMEQISRLWGLSGPQAGPTIQVAAQRTNIRLASTEEFKRVLEMAMKPTRQVGAEVATVQPDPVPPSDPVATAHPPVQ